LKQYRHYGAIGDMIKHPALSLFLTQEKPKYYCETHSASALYKLDTGFNKQYGVFHLYANAHTRSVINDSPYLRLLRSFNQNGLTLYPGSPGIALTLLKRQCDGFLFCDINSSHLDNIQELCEKLGIPDKVALYNGDGITRVSGFVNSVTDIKNTFVFIDPFDPFDISLSNVCPFDLFVSLIPLKVKTILWYGYGTLNQRKDLFDRFHAALDKNGRSSHDSPVFNGEIFLNIIQEDHSIINPGVLGCGILFANMSVASITEFRKSGQELEILYKIAVISSTYDGSISFHFGEI